MDSSFDRGLWQARASPHLEFPEIGGPVVVSLHVIIVKSHAVRRGRPYSSRKRDPGSPLAEPSTRHTYRYRKDATFGLYSFWGGLLSFVAVADPLEQRRYTD